jgi:His/Glu/Gln/Arg/opine family amino acid ABC transporter permease subunit
MSEKGSNLESEVVDDHVPRNPFRYFVENHPTFVRAKKDPLQFTLQISVWFAAIYIYYIIADEFVRQSLLNLTKDRIQGLDLPFVVLDGAVDPYTTYVTLLISIVVMTGVYSLGVGNLTPRQYDIRVQLIALLAALPLISYFILHIMYLKETDESWYFDLTFMEEWSGFTLSNSWPFESPVVQDSRWTFYRVALYNAIRVVLLSIFGCTILGTLIGVSRLSRNRMLSGIAESYVEFFRNMPLVVQLFFLYTAVIQVKLPNFSEVQENTIMGWVFWSNRGFHLPAFGIENLPLFLAAVGVFLAARVYIRFIERLPPENSDKLPPQAPIFVDILFSTSILILLYGIFNIVEWTYTVNSAESDGSLGDLVQRFLQSLFEGISEKAPFSMFMLGLFLVIVSVLSTFKLDELGMNAFTTDDSSEGLKKRTIFWSTVVIVIVILLQQSMGVVQPNLLTERVVVDDGELVKVYDLDKPAVERVIYEGAAGELAINGTSNPDDSLSGIYVHIKGLYEGGMDGGDNEAHDNKTWNLTKSDCDRVKNFTLNSTFTQNGTETIQVFTPKCNYIEDSTIGPPGNKWIIIGSLCTDGCPDGNYTWDTGGGVFVQQLGWGNWIFEDGTSQTITSVFLALWIGLTLYTTAQVAEIVRGSIQSLPRGQVEAAISLGLSPFQRLRLVILPQALRSIIPSLTNQYLNCWKNSSLALIVGFSDFYAVFNTIINKSGQAVPIFMMILLTYQAGSLVISSIMNYINSAVTKVKI